MLLFTELVAQWINETFFLVPNINILVHPCDMFSILVRKYLSRPQLAQYAVQCIIKVQVQVQVSSLYFHFFGRQEGVPFRSA